MQSLVWLTGMLPSRRLWFCINKTEFATANSCTVRYQPARWLAKRWLTSHFPSHLPLFTAERRGGFKVTAGRKRRVIARRADRIRWRIAPPRVSPPRSSSLPQTHRQRDRPCRDVFQATPVAGYWTLSLKRGTDHHNHINVLTLLLIIGNPPR